MLRDRDKLLFGTARDADDRRFGCEDAAAHSDALCAEYAVDERDEPFDIEPALSGARGKRPGLVTHREPHAPGCVDTLEVRARQHRPHQGDELHEGFEMLLRWKSQLALRIDPHGSLARKESLEVAWLLPLLPLVLLWRALFRFPSGKRLAAFFVVAYVAHGIAASDVLQKRLEATARESKATEKLAALAERQKDPAYQRQIEAQMSTCESSPKGCWTMARKYELASDYATAVRFYRVCCDGGDNMCCSFGRSTADKLNLQRNPLAPGERP